MMTVALGAGVVGSISGTVAWFQYSTRSTVAFTGTSAHCTENLQIRLVKANQEAEDDWKSDLPASDIADVLKGVTAKYKIGTAEPTNVTVDPATFYGKFAHGGEYKFVFNGTNWLLGNEEITPANMTAVYGITLPTSPAEGGYIRVIANAIDTVRPVTSSTLAEGKTASELYRNPVYQYPHMSSWQKAEASDFVTIPLELRVKDVDGKEAVSTLAKNIYVTKMDMAVKEVTGKGDITPALRVAISASEDGGAHFTDYGTFSTSGNEVETYGNLDLNGENGADTYGDFAWEKGPKILYGYEHEAVEIAVSGGASGNISAAEVNGDWFIGENGINETTENKNFVFSYTGSKWKLGETEIDDIAKYGITYTLKDNKTAPNSDDKLTVTVKAEAAGKNVADSYDLQPVSSGKGIADDRDPYNIIGEPIGATTSSQTLRVNLKIYLEGWQKLGETPSALWDAATYIGSGFNVGVRFSADAHTDH